MRIVSATLLALAAIAAEEQVSSTPDHGHPTSDETIVVTADRQPNTLTSTTASVSVLDADEDRRDGHPASWAERLRRTPGVDLLNRSGGLDSGGLPGLRLRGTQKDCDTQVLVDGIPWNDPTGTEGQPSLLSLQPSSIERIEVVRGAQSGLYGSRAVGGVVNLISERPTAAHRGRLRQEVGSFHTVTTAMAASGPLIASDGDAPTLGYAAGVSATDSNGFSTLTTASDGDPENAEDDGLRRLGVNGRIEGRPSRELTLYVAGLIGSAVHEFDDVTVDDSLPEKRERMWRGSAGGEWRLPHDSTLGFDAAYTRNQRDLDGTFGSSGFTGGEWYGSTRWSVPVASWLTLTPGVDVLRQTADSESAGVAVIDDRTVSNVGGWLQALASSENWELSLVARHDAHSNAGDATTGRAGVAWFPWQARMKLHASAGTAFRAPSLDEQYSFYDFGGFGTFAGNPDLKPQRSQSWEIGVEGEPFEGLHLGATLFSTRYENRIVFVAGFNSTLANEDSSARILGVESEATWELPGTPMELFATATFQDSEDQDGHWFVAVPQEKGSLGVTADHARGWATVALDAVGRRRDSDGSNLPGYATASVVLGWRANSRLSVYARGENLFDIHHTDGEGFAAGTYATSSPRAFYVGVEATY